MFELKDISLSFDGRNILDRFNLKVKKGDKIVLFGKSGKGKTTILRLLMGFTQPDDGKVHYKGKIMDPDIARSIRQSVSYVSQELAIGAGTVLEFIEEIFSYKANRDRELKLDRLEELKGYFELPDETLSKNIDDLSGGEKQRIAIVLALLLDRKICFLDEPTSGLDAELKKKVIDRFSRMDTVIVVSHDKEWLRKPFRMVRL